MTPRRELFIELKEATSGRVRMANNSITEVKGIGSIRFQNPDGTTFVLHEVRYMPEIGRNLISLGTLENKGCEFKASNGIMKIVMGCTVIMRGYRKGSDTLYFLNGVARKSESCSGESSPTVINLSEKDQTQLWHSRLGHVGQKGLEMLVKRGCIPSDQVSTVKFCEDCVIGKTHKVSFGPAQHLTKERLDYIHSDLWGSSNVPPSLGRCQYFLSFTDDWSRKVWVYFLKTKDETFQKFVEWKKMVEVQVERKVKKLRTDNGLEFCNLRFDQFCKDEGIVRHRTCSYTPQQNGVAERLNRSILNKVRNMLSESGLEAKFGAEAVSTAVYLLNRTPSSVIDFEIPEQRWTTEAPDLSGLRRFGCIAYTHTDDGKLNPRAKKGVFTGYPEGVKGFRIWLLDEEKCVISRNAVFREDQMYKDNKTKDNSGMVPITTNSTNKTLSFDFVGTDIDGHMEPQGGVTQDTARVPTTESQGQEESEGNTESTPQSDYQIARDRTRRTLKPPAKLQDYHVYPEDEDIAGYAYQMTEIAESAEPGSFKEAMEGPDSDKWTEASDEEMTSLKKSGTWDLVDRDEKQKPIGCKWIYKKKEGVTKEEGPRFKARLVAKGYSQKEGVDYQEIFSPVVKMVSI